MKILSFNAASFSTDPVTRQRDDADEEYPDTSWQDVLVVFIQVETVDEDRQQKIAGRAAKLIKWICSKVERKHVVLHSFAHLSESKADPAIAQSVLTVIQERLQRAGYLAEQTPWGWMNRLHLDALGDRHVDRFFKSL